MTLGKKEKEKKKKRKATERLDGIYNSIQIKRIPIQSK